MDGLTPEYRIERGIGSEIVWRNRAGEVVRRSASISLENYRRVNQIKVTACNCKCHLCECCPDTRRLK